MSTVIRGKDARITFYSGPVPSSASEAETGTVLATLSLPDDWLEPMWGQTNSLSIVLMPFALRMRKMLWKAAKMAATEAWWL